MDGIVNISDESSETQDQRLRAEKAETLADETETKYLNLRSELQDAEAAKEQAEHRYRVVWNEKLKAEEARTQAEVERDEKQGKLNLCSDVIDDHQRIERSLRADNERLREAIAMFGNWDTFYSLVIINNITKMSAEKKEAEKQLAVVVAAKEQAEVQRDQVRRMIRHCENCGGNWVDDGITPGCMCADNKRLRALRAWAQKVGHTSLCCYWDKARVEGEPGPCNCGLNEVLQIKEEV